MGSCADGERPCRRNPSTMNVLNDAWTDVAKGMGAEELGGHALMEWRKCSRLTCWPRAGGELCSISARPLGPPTRVAHMDPEAMPDERS